ncbi:Unknown protein, partial [Striga hermonthica]
KPQGSKEPRFEGELYNRVDKLFDFSPNKQRYQQLVKDYRLELAGLSPGVLDYVFQP